MGRTRCFVLRSINLQNVDKSVEEGGCCACDSPAGSPWITPDILSPGELLQPSFFLEGPRLLFPPLEQGLRWLLAEGVVPALAPLLGCPPGCRAGARGGPAMQPGEPCGNPISPVLPSRRCPYRRRVLLKRQSAPTPPQPCSQACPPVPGVGAHVAPAQ
jgi:hypothetical protein